MIYWGVNYIYSFIMKKNTFDPFKQIKDYAHNPLGIVAMFISLIYGFAALLLGLSADKLTANERTPLIWFIIFFPCLILIVFYRLVTKHHGKLYSPSDYREDSSFLETISPAERQLKYEKEAKEVLSAEMPTQTNKDVINNVKPPMLPPNFISKLVDISKELRAINDRVVAIIERELNINAQRNVRVGPTNTGLIVDAAFMTKSDLIFLEIKLIRYPTSDPADSILFAASKLYQLYQNQFKLIIVVVYSFEKDKLPAIEKEWIAKIERVPAQIILRFISQNELNTTEKILHQ